MCFLAVSPRAAMRSTQLSPCGSISSCSPPHTHFHKTCRNLVTTTLSLLANSARVSQKAQNCVRAKKTHENCRTSVSRAFNISHRSTERLQRWMLGRRRAGDHRIEEPRSQQKERKTLPVLWQCRVSRSGNSPALASTLVVTCPGWEIHGEDKYLMNCKRGVNY